MLYLTAAVVLVGLLCLLDLMLTLAVIRRLREHTGLLSRLSQPPASVGVPAGGTVAEFAATGTGGEVVSREALTERTLVGFFSPGCQPCAEQLPQFVDHAQAWAGGRAHVLAVVVGTADPDETDEADEADEVAPLVPVAQVVTERPGGPMQEAFQVTAFPAIYVLDPGGVVVASGVSMAALAEVPVSVVTAA